jgi:hypothetical protein
MAPIPLDFYLFYSTLRFSAGSLGSELLCCPLAASFFDKDSLTILRVAHRNLRTINTYEGFKTRIAGAGISFENQPL